MTTNRRRVAASDQENTGASPTPFPATPDPTPLRSARELIDLAGPLSVPAYRRHQSRTLAQQSFALLRQQAGLLRDILRKLPSRLLDQAEKNPDPWAFLIKQIEANSKLTAKQRQPFVRLFRACASQNVAAHALARIAGNIATVNRDPVKMLQTARRLRTESAMSALNEEVAIAYHHTQAGKSLSRVMEMEGASDELAEILSKRYARDVQRLGRRKADARWRPGRISTPKADTIQQKVANILVSYWSVGPEGSTGFMFLSDEDLASLVGSQLGIPGVTFGRIREVRKKLGLLKATPALKTQRIHSAKAADSL